MIAAYREPDKKHGKAINGRLEHLRGSALGFPEPDELHRTLVARSRRIQTPTTPSIAMSPFGPRRLRRHLTPARVAT
jgi:hypothetical protein